MQVRFWGVRGLVASPGTPFRRYGGDTLCVEVVTDAGARLILDLGTGGIALGSALAGAACKGGSKRLAVLLSSTHLDHIHGLPFFVPALAPGWDLTIMGPCQSGSDISGILDGALNPNYSPLYGVENLTPRLDMTTLTEGELTWDGIRIVTRELPNGKTPSLGLRLEADGATLAYLADVEYEGPPSAAAIDLASEADLLVHDGMGTLPMVVKRRGVPVVRPEDAMQVAREAEVKSLLLYRHDPDLTDAAMEILLADLRQGSDRFTVDAAKVGTTIELGSRMAAKG